MTKDNSEGLQPPTCHKKFDRNCQSCKDWLFENGGWMYVALGMSKQKDESV